MERVKTPLQRLDVINAKEKAVEISLNGLYLCRRRPTLPHTFACSTIGPAGLNFRVRDGNGCFPRGKITGFVDVWRLLHHSVPQRRSTQDLITSILKELAFSIWHFGQSQKQPPLATDFSQLNSIRISTTKAGPPSRPARWLVLQRARGHTLWRTSFCAK